MKHMPVPTDDLRERFILFLASKPADLAYDWNSVAHCACGTFIEECLPKTVKAWYSPWSVERADPVQTREVWARWNNIASVHPHTYGALLERVRNQ